MMVLQRINVYGLLTSHIVSFFALFGNVCEANNDEGLHDMGCTCTYVYDSIRKSPPHVYFVCPGSVSDQFDLLAATKNVNYNQEKGVPVNLELCHALTAVQFSIGNLPKDYKLTKVELKEIKTEGTYTFPTADHQSGKWNLSDVSGKLTCDSIPSPIGENTIILGKNPGKKENKWEKGDNCTFFVIPQDYKGIKVCLTLINTNKNKDKNKDEEPKEIPIVISLGKGEFAPGTTKIFNLSFSNSWNTFITEGPGTIYVNSDMVNFNVFSYSQKDSKSPSTDEKWEFVGYEDDNNDAIQKPDWLTVETTQGKGGYNTGNISINYTKRDIIFPWDKELAKAPLKGDENHPYNLANKNGEEKIVETANCYVISAPGTYAIPLVYGNAIKNESENKGSYRYTDGNDNGTTLLNFKNSEGENIKSPYIKTATDAEILWQDRSDMLSIRGKIVKTDKSYDCNSYDYLLFTVTKDQIKSGNALIAVKDGNKDVNKNDKKDDDEYLWSWHLWFVPEKEYGGIAERNGYKIAEYPLGYTPYEYRPGEDDADRKVKLVFRQKDHPEVKSKFTVKQICRTEHLFYMTYYQHGRKDPFSGDVVHAQNKIEAVNGKKSLAYGIQHPNRLINFDYKDNWCNPNYFNLWDSYFSIGESDPFSNDNNKTIYDPCPAGYKVPPANAFNGIEYDGGEYDADKYGWTFSGIKVKDAKSKNKNDLFIPMTGDVQCVKGKPVSYLYYVENGKFPYPEAQGFYQLAFTTSTKDLGRPSTSKLLLDYGEVKFDIVHNLAQADAVLPVKDE